MEKFQEALIGLYQKNKGAHPELAEHFDGYLDVLRTAATANEGYEAQAHDLQDAFASYIRSEGDADYQLLKEALLEIEDQLRWFHFEEQDMRFPGMLKSMTFCQIIGPCDGFGDAMYSHDTLNAGIFLQGPEFFYPPHFHDSVELYHILAGKSYWKRGEEDWCPRKPGEWILHDREQLHAMRTDAEPIVTLWAWYGGPKAPILFSDTDFHGNPQ